MSTVTPTSIRSNARTLERSNVVIVGGGISGLSAAWFLEQALPGVRYTLLEASNRWGGKIRTERVAHAGGTFIIEKGADSFLTRKPWALDLARALGMEAALIPTLPAAKKVSVLHRGRPVLMPEGLRLTVPTQWGPLLRTPLLSPLGKLRMGLERFLPPKNGENDSEESLAGFVTRRFGAEALERFAEPMMAGIYSADPAALSLRATFPSFEVMEQQHGSLTKGMRATARRTAQNGLVETPVFMSMREGMATFPQRLAARLNGELRLNSTVKAIRRDEEGLFRLTLDDGEHLLAEQVLLTTPAPVAARLLAEVAPRSAAHLSQIRHASSGTLTLAYRAASVRDPLPGAGLVIPRSENHPFNAMTLSSRKFDHRAPEGMLLLRLFFGGARQPQMMEASDEALLELASETLHNLLGVHDDPLFHRVQRWHSGNPQYEVGHLARVDAAQQALPPGIHLSGTDYQGVGIPDCVRQAEEAVERVSIGALERSSVRTFERN